MDGRLNKGGLGDDRGCGLCRLDCEEECGEGRRLGKKEKEKK